MRVMLRDRKKKNAITGMNDDDNCITLCFWRSVNLEGRNPEAVGQIRFVGLQQSDVGQQLVLCAVPLVCFFFFSRAPRGRSKPSHK